MTRMVPWLPLLAVACRGLRRLPHPSQAWNGGERVSRRPASQLLSNVLVLFSSLLLACSGSHMSLAQSTINIFRNAVPANPVVADYNSVTLGLKFYSTQPGTISGIRFYRGHRNQSGYTVKLFSAGGSLLASAKTSNDTCNVPCWEQVNFSAPISIAANTTYVAAYYTSNGDYADDTGTSGGLTNGESSGSLIAPSSSQVGGNGVYTYSTGFPNQTWENSNYYVDVAFTPVAPSLIMTFSPASPTIPSNSPGGTVVATVNVSWSNGSPFTGTITFGAPNSSTDGAFALSGNQVIVNQNPSGPALSGDGGTTQNLTIVATQ
jgi:hypothetical protein